MTDLLCMRLADMIRVHPKQIQGRCAVCDEVVGIYPSGQRVLKERPDVRIVCNVCQEPGGVTMLAPGAEIEPFFSRKKTEH